MLLKLANIASILLLSSIASSIVVAKIDEVQLPEMGDSSGTLISPIQEKELGDSFFRSLHGKIEISQDIEIQEYIQSTGKQLVANTDQPSNPYLFFVVLDNQINAFAGPGGYIGINSGLILLTDSESELASVMAHEVAHITQRHLYRAFEAASKLSVPTAAATLAAILLATQSPEAGQAALMAIQAGSVQFQIDFTRDNEKEADRIGIQTLAKSNFNPRSMPIFFERLQQSSRYYGRDIPEFLRTHPVSSSRISDTRGRAEQYPYKQFPDSIGYQLIKAKLRVVTSVDKKIALAHFKALEHQGTKQQQAIARYGIGLIYQHNHKFDEAEKIFKQLRKQYPNQPQYTYAIAKLALTAQKFEKAVSLFEKAVSYFPSNNAIKMEYIASLLKIKKAEKAQQILQTLNYQVQKKAVYFELLAQIHAMLKQPAESHRYLAEYYYASGHTDVAILQIELAKKIKDSNRYLQAILDQRLIYFLNEEKQRKLDR